MRVLVFLICIILFAGCSSKNQMVGKKLEEALLEQNADHESQRMRFKLVESKCNDKSAVWAQAQKQIEGFTSADYDRLFPLIYEKGITQIQEQISKGTLSYEQLTQWYIYRILKYEKNPETSLHAIISINPNAVAEARKKDQMEGRRGVLYGMPILLKDNVGFEGLATTAGAAVLKNNYASHAFITQRLLDQGAIILAKVNLSEWAYYFCDGCPLGYSAMGGQSLNPYGRGVFETGGSSAASGTAIAANYAVAAIGTETAGSILSPSAHNSLVGLKPTIGLCSRRGIVPISSSYDTPGPMTRSVEDNAIILNAISGYDKEDSFSRDARTGNYFADLKTLPSSDFKLAANESFMESVPIFKTSVEKLKRAQLNVQGYKPPEVSFDGFLTVLNHDMQYDMKDYLGSHTSRSVEVKSVNDIIAFNMQNMDLYAPYGQALLINVSQDSTSKTEIAEIKSKLMEEGRRYFDAALDDMSVDAVLSVNNYDAAYAAVAKYPCLIIPMGLDEKGEPKGMTLIGKPFNEKKLLQMGVIIESILRGRAEPKDFK